MKFFALLAIFLSFEIQAETQTIITCDNNRLYITKTCNHICDYDLFVNDRRIVEHLLMDVDFPYVKLQVFPVAGWGNFDSSFTTIGTEERNSYMKVTLSQNGAWEELSLKSFTHYRGGNPYFYADWTFRSCKSINKY